MAANLDRSASAYYYYAGILAQSLTVSMWFWPKQTQIGPDVTFVTFAQGHLTNSIRYIRGGISSGSGFITTRNDTGGETGYTTNTINDQTVGWITPGASNWHHLVLQWTKSTVYTNSWVTLDGGTRSQVAINSRNLTTQNTTLGLHRYSTTLVAPFDGYIAEIGYWPTVLSESDVGLLSRGYSPLAVMPAQLSAYWPLVTNVSASAQDRIGTQTLQGYGDPAAADNPPLLHVVPNHYYHINKPSYIPAQQHLLTLTPKMGTPVATNSATLGLRNRHPILSFDDSTDQEIVFDTVMPQMFPGSVNLSVKMKTTAATASAGSAIIGAAFERVSGSIQDVDNDGFGAFVKSGIGTRVTSGETSVVTLKYKTGNQVRRIQPGEKFRLKVKRFASYDTDTLDGKLELHDVEIRY